MRKILHFKRKRKCENCIFLTVEENRNGAIFYKCNILGEYVKPSDYCDMHSYSVEEAERKLEEYKLPKKLRSKIKHLIEWIKMEV